MRRKTAFRKDVIEIQLVGIFHDLNKTYNSEIFSPATKLNKV